MLTPRPSAQHFWLTASLTLFALYFAGLAQCETAVCLADPRREKWAATARRFSRRRFAPYLTDRCYKCHGGEKKRAAASISVTR